MKEGDLIVGIGDDDVKWAPHGDVVELIKDAGARLTLKLVTPMDKNYSRVGMQSTILSSLLASAQREWCDLFSFRATKILPKVL